MNLLNGKEVKLKILKDLKQDIEKLNQVIGLTVIQIGDDPASNIYINQKLKMAEEVGINFQHIKLESSVDEKYVLNLIDNLNNDDSIDGILVQMPIPQHLNPKKIQNRISYDKDVDGLTDINIGRLMHNEDCLTACTALGIIDLLEYYDIDINGKNVVIIGRSDLVGKPLYALMLNKNATVTMCHSKTENLMQYTKLADILVVAIGKPNYIKKEFIKDGAIVVDVGINRLNDNKICGDVDFENVKEKTLKITPVPGGVGQMTVAELGKNTYKAHIMRNKLK